MHLCSLPQDHVGAGHADGKETTQAVQAVAGGQVRRALRHGVEHHRAVRDARGEPPRRCSVGRLLYCSCQKIVEVDDSKADIVEITGDVLVAPPRHGHVVPRRIGGREDVVVREEEDAVFTIHVGGLVALLRRRRCHVQDSTEPVGHAFAAGGIVGDVAAAERESIDSVWGSAESDIGEVRWGRRGVLGEDVGDLFEVVAENVGGRRKRREAGDEHEEQDVQGGVHHGLVG